MDFSYQSIVQELEERLSQKSSWAKIFFYSIIRRIIDLIAYVISKFAYMTEYFYQESNWTTAVLRKSLATKAEFLSYQIHRKIGASGFVRVTADSTWTNYEIVALDSGTKKISILDDKTTEFSGKTQLTIEDSTNNNNLYTISSVTFNSPNTEIIVVGSIDDTELDGNVFIYKYTGESISIPRWTTLSNLDGDTHVYTDQDYSYNKNEIGTINVTTKEGLPKEFTYTSEGNPNEEIDIFADNIDNTEIEIFIVDTSGNILHNVSIVGVDTEEQKLYFINDIDNYYCEVNNGTDFESVKIIFGDNVHGKQLALNDRVLIKYATTQGEEGNIYSQDIITQFDEKIYTLEGEEITLYPKNKEEISNGDDIEEIEHIRNYGTRIFQAGYRAGGENDWITILENHSLIHKAKIWYDETYINKVNVTAISTDGSELTPTQQGIISLDMKDLKSPTEIISWEPLNIIYTLFKVTPTVKNVPFSTVNDEIKTILTNTYDILQTDFFQNVYFSNYINLIDDIDNVIEHDTELYHMEKNQGNSFSYNTVNHIILVSKPAVQFPIATEQILLNPISTEIWLERKISNIWQEPIICAKDLTGAGTLTGQNGYNVASSTLDYVSNSISFNIDTLANVGVYGLPDIDWILYIAYKTQDGNGDQVKHIRLSNEYQITDIDENYIFITSSYQT